MVLTFFNPTDYVTPRVNRESIIEGWAAILRVTPRTIRRRLVNLGVNIKRGQRGRLYTPRQAIEVQRERDRRYRSENVDEIKRRNRRYWRVKGRAKRQTKKAAGQYHKYKTHRRPSTVNTLFQRQKGRCAYCHRKIRADSTSHVDHIKPRSLGGSNKRTNLQLLCPKCNLAKGAKPPEFYARSIGLLF